MKILELVHKNEEQKFDELVKGYTLMKTIETIQGMGLSVEFREKDFGPSHDKTILIHAPGEDEMSASILSYVFDITDADIRQLVQLAIKHSERD